MISPAERTRSRRWRAGSRRNKRHPVTHIQVCPEPHRCLVHIVTTKFYPPREPMRMRLTRCEQKWIDDMKAGRVHVHTRKPLRYSREGAILALRQRINTKRFADAGTINATAPRVSMGYHNPHPGVIAAVDVSQAAARNLVTTTLAGKTYRPDMDISGRWYPRGE